MEVKWGNTNNKTPFAQTSSIIKIKCPTWNRPYTIVCNWLLCGLLKFELRTSSCQSWIRLKVTKQVKTTCACVNFLIILTLSWTRPLLYRNQFIDLLCKSMDWFLYDNNPRHERFKHWNQRFLSEMTTPPRYIYTTSSFGLKYIK